MGWLQTAVVRLGGVTMAQFWSMNSRREAPVPFTSTSDYSMKSRAVIVNRFAALPGNPQFAFCLLSRLSQVRILQGSPNHQITI